MPQHCLPSPALLPMVSLVYSTMHPGMLKLSGVCLHPSCSSLQHSFAECLQGAGDASGSSMVTGHKSSLVQQDWMRHLKLC